MDIQQKQQQIIKSSLAAPIVKAMNCSFEYNEKGQAVWTLPFSKTWTNGMVVHGGAIGTLIDNAGCSAVLPHWEFLAVTIEFQTRLIEPVMEGDLVATGSLVKLGKKIATATVEVKASEKLVAIGSGSYALTSVPIPI